MVTEKQPIVPFVLPSTREPAAELSLEGQLRVWAPAVLSFSKVIEAKSFILELLKMFFFCPCVRLDRPRGGSRLQRLHALACRQPPLGRSELRQGKGHGGDEHRPFLTVPQDAMVAPGHLRAQRPLTPHSAGATAMDLPLFGPFLPRPVAPKQPQPGQ